MVQWTLGHHKHIGEWGGLSLASVENPGAIREIGYKDEWQLAIIFNHGSLAMSSALRPGENLECNILVVNIWLVAGFVICDTLLALF